MASTFRRLISTSIWLILRVHEPEPEYFVMLLQCGLKGAERQDSVRLRLNAVKECAGLRAEFNDAEEHSDSQIPPLNLQHRFAAIVKSVEQHKAQPASPPRRTGHPLRLPAIPCLPGRPLKPSMEISTNFAFLKQEFPHAAESASYAERHVYAATRGLPASMQGMRWSAWSSVSTRSTKTLNPPKVTNLDAYLSERRLPCARA